MPTNVGISILRHAFIFEVAKNYCLLALEMRWLAEVNMQFLVKLFPLALFGLFGFLIVIYAQSAGHYSLPNYNNIS